MYSYHWCCHNHHHFSLSLSLSLPSSSLLFPFTLQLPILVSISFLLLSLFSARAPSRFSLCLVLVISTLRHRLSLLLECERTSSPLLSNPRFVLFECFFYCYFFCLPPNRLIPVLEPFFRVLVVGISRVSFLSGLARLRMTVLRIRHWTSSFPSSSFFSLLSASSLLSLTPLYSLLSFSPSRIRRSSRPAGSRLVRLLCLPLQRLLRRILPRTTLSVTDIPILSPTNQPLHIRPRPLLPPLVWLPLLILTLSTLRRPPSLLLNPPRSFLLRHPPRRRPWLRPRTA